MDFIDKNLQSYVESHSDSETELLEEINRYTNLNVLNPRMLSGHLQGRILSFISENDIMTKGERIGLIRFGSRVDIYLPLNYQIKVHQNDIVAAGKTIIAER